MPQKNMNQTIKTDRRITLIGKNGQAVGRLVDLSLKEAGITTPRGARVGTELELVFELPALEQFITLRIKSTVTHRHNSSDSIYLKFRFGELSKIDAAALEDFVGYKLRLLAVGRKQSKHRLNY